MSQIIVKTIAIEDEPGVGVLVLKPGAFEEVAAKAVQHGFSPRLIWKNKFCMTNAVGPFDRSPALMAWLHSYLGNTPNHLVYVSSAAFE